MGSHKVWWSCCLYLGIWSKSSSMCIAGNGLARMGCSGSNCNTGSKCTFLFFIFSEDFGSNNKLFSQRSTDAADLHSQSSAGLTAGNINGVGDQMLLPFSHLKANTTCSPSLTHMSSMGCSKLYRLSL